MEVHVLGQLDVATSIPATFNNRRSLVCRDIAGMN